MENNKIEALRKEVRADIELTQALLRNTITRQESQEDILKNQSEMLRQQSEMLQQQSDMQVQLMRHQLEGIQDTRKLEQTVGKLGQSLDALLGYQVEAASREELQALESRLSAVERRLDAA